MSFRGAFDVDRASLCCDGSDGDGGVCVHLLPVVCGAAKRNRGVRAVKGEEDFSKEDGWEGGGLQFFALFFCFDFHTHIFSVLVTFCLLMNLEVAVNCLRVASVFMAAQ